MTGKIGTDIEDNKCSWLVVQALKKVTAEQREVLEVKDLHMTVLSPLCNMVVLPLEKLWPQR